MNKNILSILAIALSFATFGQKFDIRLPGQSTNLAGTTVEFDITTTDDIIIDFEVTNISGQSLEALAGRKIISGPSSWTDLVCFGANCYNPEQANHWMMENSEAYPLNNNESAVAQMKIKPSSPNHAVYRYYFGTMQNQHEDSVDVRINNVLSVKELKKEFSLNVAPNPANDVLTIKATGVETATLKMVDVLGNVVLIDTFSGSKTINTSSFKNGVYFVLVSGNGIANTNRKVVIRH